MIVTRGELLRVIIDIGFPADLDISSVANIETLPEMLDEVLLLRLQQSLKQPRTLV